MTVPSRYHSWCVKYGLGFEKFLQGLIEKPVCQAGQVCVSVQDTAGCSLWDSCPAKASGVCWKVNQDCSAPCEIPGIQRHGQHDPCFCSRWSSFPASLCFANTPRSSLPTSSAAAAATDSPQHPKPHTMAKDPSLGMSLSPSQPAQAASQRSKKSQVLWWER